MAQDHLWQLLEYTDRSVFITGRAGTGKTTILNNFVRTTQKNVIVTAPTGIAAINAQGVTLHSLFSLPLSTYIPANIFVDRNEAINTPLLLAHFRYNKAKQDLLRNLEALIIDEVSMLRCDVLDMIDLALRTVRKNKRPFGGVQLILFGDLFQLPPVLKKEDEFIISQYYTSPFFYSAQSLRNNIIIQIELSKIYRQIDQNFIDILEAVRNRNLSEAQLSKLNQRFQPAEKEKTKAIYLVSHNYQADDINSQRMKAIKAPPYQFTAEISGDFKESLFPVEQVLTLKLGAQVMFIRNDTSEEKLYFNGKIATITSINENEIFVSANDQNESFEVKKVKWDNKKYYTDDSGSIKEEYVGNFTQYPIRPAWAITIHKSQGLTFDHLIIDAGRSFTAGQVYVALSRCRSLEGIILKSPISSTLLFDNYANAIDFQTMELSDLENITEQEKHLSFINKIIRQTSVTFISNELEEWKKIIKKSKTNLHPDASTFIELIRKSNTRLSEIHEKFATYLMRGAHKPAVESDTSKDKLLKGVNYFYHEVISYLLDPVIALQEDLFNKKNVGKILTFLDNFSTRINAYLSGLEKLNFENKQIILNVRKQVTPEKQIKLASHLITFDLFKSGDDIQTIAKKRELSIGTIWIHMSKLLLENQLEITEVMPEDRIVRFKSIYENNEAVSLAEWKNIVNDEYSFGELRILLNYFQELASSTNK